MIAVWLWSGARMITVLGEGMLRWARGVCAAVVCLAGTEALGAIEVPIIYLQREVDRPPVLSNLDPVPEDLGVAGAELGQADNATTGGFLGHNYSLEVVSVGIEEDLAAAAREALSQSRILVIDAPAADVVAIADLPEAAGAILFNATAPDQSLRGTACRANLLHTLPSHAMRADALMQFALFRQWDSLAMLVGPHEKDQAFADALRASAVKFGITIAGEKSWAFDADMRRNASEEVPVFTQDLAEHDMLLVADEIGDFGRYVAYNTWAPRPLGGSEGVVPTAWSRVVEQWGASQLQSRFGKGAGRAMLAEDYAAWAAVRTIGEAVTRTTSADPAALWDFILSPEFALAGFKGRPLSFRTWNGQMRQPIPLVTERALVAQAPLPGFLHERTELDTLGTDAPESSCEAFQ